MASSDSDYDSTEEDDDDEEDGEEQEEDSEEDDGKSEYSLEEEDDEEEDEDEEGSVAEEEVGFESSDEDEEMPALEHGEQAEPDEISEGPDAPLSGISTPVDPFPEDQHSARKIQPDTKEGPCLQPAAAADLASGDGMEGSATASSLSADLQEAKLDSADFASGGREKGTATASSLSADLLHKVKLHSSAST